MRKIIEHVGKSKGEKSVSIRIGKQKSPGSKVSTFSITRTTTEDLVKLVREVVFPLLEDKINISDVLVMLNKIKKVTKDNGVVELIKSFEALLKK